MQSPQKRERARIELLASLDLAEQALDAGEGETYTNKSLHELVASIEQRGRQKLTLDKLLEGIPEGAAMEEIDWGPPRGVEFW
jgi:hypothetical protein